MYIVARRKDYLQNGKSILTPTSPALFQKKILKKCDLKKKYEKRVTYTLLFFQVSVKFYSEMTLLMICAKKRNKISTHLWQQYRKMIIDFLHRAPQVSFHHKNLHIFFQK